MRDQFAYRLCNLILRLFASKEYQDEITILIKLGTRQWAELTDSERQYMKRLAELERE